MFTDPMTFTSAIGKLFTEEALILGTVFFGGLCIDLKRWFEEEQYEEEFEEDDYEVEIDRDIPVKRMGKKVGKVKM